MHPIVPVMARRPGHVGLRPACLTDESLFPASIACIQRVCMPVFTCTPGTQLHTCRHAPIYLRSVKRYIHTLSEFFSFLHRVSYSRHFRIDSPSPPAPCSSYPRPSCRALSGSAPTGWGPSSVPPASATPAGARASGHCFVFPLFYLQHKLNTQPLTLCTATKLRSHHTRYHMTRLSCTFLPHTLRTGRGRASSGGDFQCNPPPNQTPSRFPPSLFCPHWSTDPPPKSPTGGPQRP